MFYCNRSTNICNYEFIGINLDQLYYRIYLYLRERCLLYPIIGENFEGPIALVKRVYIYSITLFFQGKKMKKKKEKKLQMSSLQYN